MVRGLPSLKNSENLVDERIERASERAFEIWWRSSSISLARVWNKSAYQMLADNLSRKSFRVLSGNRLTFLSLSRERDLGRDRFLSCILRISIKFFFFFDRFHYSVFGYSIKFSSSPIFSRTRNRSIASTIIREGGSLLVQHPFRSGSSDKIKRRREFREINRVWPYAVSFYFPVAAAFSTGWRRKEVIRNKNVSEPACSLLRALTG